MPELSEHPTELPDLDELHIDEVRRIWAELAEMIYGGYANDQLFEWKRAALAELESRVETEYPDCPHCGHSGDWSQSVGEPKYCGECGQPLGLEHEDIETQINQQWEKVQAPEDIEKYGDAKHLVPIDEETRDHMQSLGEVSGNA